MGLIDAYELSDFFFSETSGTEEIIHDLMQKHGLNYANSVNEDAVMYFAIDLLKGAQNVIDTQPIAYDPDKVVEQLEKRTAFLNGCTKYNNETAEQQKKSYDTMMMYEVKDLVDDLLEIVKEGGVNAKTDFIQYRDGAGKRMVKNIEIS